MRCTEPLDLASLKSMISVGTWTDDALQIVLDASVDFLFSLLGHSFGRAIRIYHDESYGATAATVQATATQIALAITGGTKAAGSPYEYDFDPYSDMIDLVDVISQADIGFVATLVEGMSPTEETTNLHTLAATDCFGLSARQVLCVSQITETMDGGEHMIFTSLPIRSIVGVVHDGVTETDYWEKSAGYLIAKYCVGSRYSPYVMDWWSVKQPCAVTVTYVPTFLRIPGVMKLALRALCQNTIIDSGLKAEGIGDYNYVKGDVWASIAPFWTMLSQYSINFMP